MLRRAVPSSQERDEATIAEVKSVVLAKLAHSVAKTRRRFHARLVCLPPRWRFETASCTVGWLPIATATPKAANESITYRWNF
jgi:hypothetical protein